MTVSGPEVFTLDAEQLAHKAEGWDPNAHSPLETIHLISDLTRMLLSERGSRATRAEMMKQSNIAYGLLEEELREAKRALEVMSQHAESLEEEFKGAKALAASLANEFERTKELLELSEKRELALLLKRGWLSRLAERIEDWLAFGKTTRLGP